ncbi:MAG: DNA helicase PriA, partial [Syntrophomonas sp.]
MGSIIEYKCLNCKASLEFNPLSQKWKCGYCLSEFEKEQLVNNASEEDSLNQDMAELDLYNCTSCGAQL